MGDAILASLTMGWIYFDFHMPEKSVLRCENMPEEDANIGVRNTDFTMTINTYKRTK
jgi:hypothetical protein